MRPCNGFHEIFPFASLSDAELEESIIIPNKAIKRARRRTLLIGLNDLAFQQLTFLLKVKESYRGEYECEKLETEIQAAKTNVLLSRQEVNMKYQADFRPSIARPSFTTRMKEFDEHETAGLLMYSHLLNLVSEYDQ